MDHRKPRILYLTRNCPFGQSFGGQLRTLHLARLLKQFSEVDLGLLLLEECDPRSLEKTRSEFGLKVLMQMERRPIRGLAARLRHELDPSFLNTEGWELSEKDAAELRGLTAQYDAVWIHNLAVANGAGVRVWPRTILDVDDLRTQFHRSSVSCARSWAERARGLRHVWLWKRRESVLLRRFSVLVVCSEADQQHLGGSDRVVVVPNGFELPEKEPVRCPVDPPRIGFIGLLSYPPNARGLNWFLDAVWPEIKRQHKSVRLRLVGRGADPGLGSRGPDIDVLGWVEDSAAEIATWSHMIVPIQVGGGTRIKIAEGFSRKCPVVSTRLGAFGYDVASGDHLLLADQPGDFAQACLSLLRRPALAERLAGGAWEKYRKEWTWEAMAPGVGVAVERCLRSPRLSS